MRRASFLGVLLGLSAGCGAVTLPPASAPPPSLPSLDHPDPEPKIGFSRVVFTTDVPAGVYEVTDQRGRNGKVVRAIDRTPVCEPTPCAALLAYGDHELEFFAVDREHFGTVKVHVDKDEKIVNQTLNLRHEPVTHFVGIMGAIVGVGLVSLAAIWALQKEMTPQGNRDLAFTGLGTVAVGGLMMLLSPVQKREGATTQWSRPTSQGAAPAPYVPPVREPETPPLSSFPSPGGRVVGAALGFRF